MMLKFYKLEGLGNDFILFDCLKQALTLKKSQIQKLCDRHFGIGADGILILNKSYAKKADFQMRIFNADGSEAEMCGNGIRCLAQYLYQQKLVQKSRVKIQTLAGIMVVKKQKELFQVRMGKPEFAPQKVPVLSPKPVLGKTLRLNQEEFQVSCLSMGNPHCVIVVEKLEDIDLNRVGPQIENHPWFPERTNVEFVKVLSRNHLKVRVWERGAGITLACGTGACASLVACAKLGLANKSAKVSLPGGDLWIDWKKNACYLTGPARIVYQGLIKLSA